MIYGEIQRLTFGMWSEIFTMRDPRTEQSGGYLILRYRCSLYIKKV